MNCEHCKYYWNNGKDEYCDKRGWDFKYTDCPDFTSKYKPLTNADRIRVMTDDELAEFLNGKNFCAHNFDCEKGIRPCRECNLDWLKQEAKE